MANYALPAILLATLLLQQASAASASTSASPSAKQASKDDPRVFLGLGSNNGVTLDTEAIISTTVFFILGSVFALFAYEFLFQKDRYYYDYDDSTGYSNYGHDHTYTVHRSIDNAAKKYEK
ncbi:uncharacterized protein LOC122249144 [Penaeus japonicus]|uniref:uncharacterized protein LOC122249144 n=1 Tax=Penaeus japonicus TaxID=27405 RepID=UPI001C70E7D1|nr:uncharacterized protein LOC122249144 [Penaeus japonicus]